MSKSSTALRYSENLAEDLAATQINVFVVQDNLKWNNLFPNYSSCCSASSPSCPRLAAGGSRKKSNMHEQEQTVTPILQAPQLLLAACQHSEFSYSLSLLLGHPNVWVVIGSFSCDAVTGEQQYPDQKHPLSTSLF